MVNIVLGADADNCDSCGLPCDLCSGNRVPIYLLLKMADWTDYDCPAANAACPSAPSPISPSSSLNTTIQLDLVPALSQAGESGCYAWYEGSFAYGDFLRNDSDGPTIDDCSVVSGAAIRFAVLVASLGGGDKALQFYTYIGDGFYQNVSSFIFDTFPWFCTTTESDALSMDGYTAITAGTGEDPADYAGIFTSYAPCLSLLPAAPTVTLQASAATTTLAA